LKHPFLRLQIQLIELCMLVRLSVLYTGGHVLPLLSFQVLFLSTFGAQQFM
jgi:hypothetical protein